MFCFTNPCIPRYSCTAQRFYMKEKEAGCASSNGVYREILSKTNTCVNDFNYVYIKNRTRSLCNLSNSNRSWHRKNRRYILHVCVCSLYTRRSFEMTRCWDNWYFKHFILFFIKKERSKHFVLLYKNRSPVWSTEHIRFLVVSFLCDLNTYGLQDETQWCSLIWKNKYNWTEYS